MKHCLLFISLFLALNLQAQYTWMGKRQTNSSIVLDPSEIQMFGTIATVLNQPINEYQYIPFAFGASKSIVSKLIDNNRTWEMVAEFGVFTQFEWTTIDGKQQRNLLNADYKAAFSYVRKQAFSTFRVRFFHVSTHLGDDYIFRNALESHTFNNRNYEQIDFTYYRNLRPNWRVYAGLGSVVRPNIKRRPFSYQIGSQREFLKEKKQFALSCGINLQGFQETSFTPNVKTAFGVAYIQEDNEEPIRLLLEFYSGHLPYSQKEKETIDWLGIGLYFYI